MTTDYVEVALGVHRAFDRAGIPHALGGAIALAYAVDEPRATLDVDVNVFVPAAACRRAFEALPPEVGWTDSDVERATRDGQLRLRWGDTALDLFFDYHEIHAEAAAHRRLVPFGDDIVPVLGPDELAVFKAFFDRNKDWVDLEEMSRCGSIDPLHLADLVRDLLGGDDPRVARAAALPTEPDDSRPKRLPPRPPTAS